MVDLLGPADAGAINTLTTTSDVTSPVAGDTWFQDCAGGVSGTGTPEVAKYINRLLQQARVAIRGSNVPQSNAYDDMLSWAMQSGYANWVGTFGGTANALTGAASNSPIAVQVGTLIRGIASAANTGAVTFNWSGIGAHAVVKIDGTALTGGEIASGQRLVLMWDGTSWVIVSPLALAWLISQFPNPFTTTGVGAVVIGYPGTSSSPLPEVGNTTSFNAFSTTNSINFGSGGVYAVQDSRWLSSTIPGTWELAQVAAAFSGGWTSGAGVAVIVRIA
jgi:hypothetical protein